MREYKTKPRQLLYNFLEKNPHKQFTAEEIVSSLEAVSLSSVYRNISHMIKDGSVKRFQQKDKSGFLYQFVGEKCHEHLHLKCSNCGQILHIDENQTLELEEVVKNTFNFNLDKHSTILFGSCKECDPVEQVEVDEKE